MAKSLYANYLKRLLDIVVALPLAIGLLPVGLILAVIIKCTSRGPIFFKQPRTGKNGGTFTMLKFRSMSADNNVHDARRADQVTSIGKIMRKTSLDELPQIINVLKGDMSFIGPRPWITEYHKHMTKQQRVRHSVRPGITGRAQAFGRNALSIHDKIKHDLEYVRLVSLREDLRIIRQTLRTIGDKSVAELGKHGIHSELAELRAQWIFPEAEQAETPKLALATIPPTAQVKHRKKALFTATVDSHILHFHLPYLKLLHDLGYEVHVITNGKSPIPGAEQRFTVPFARSPFSSSNFKAYRQLRAIIDREGYDLIHTHTPMGGVVTRLAARRARSRRDTRVIYTAHGFHFYKGAPWHYWAIFYPIEKWLARYTDTLITINQEDYDLARRKFKTHVKYVPGVGIDPAKFDFKFTSTDKLKLRRSLGLKKDDFVMIFPAELNKNKNQQLLIRAVAELRQKHQDVHLLLPGEDNNQGRCQELSRAKNLTSAVHFLGYRSDIPALLKISDVALSSSLREGLPVNIIESMHAGLPAIATGCRGNRDLVKSQGIRFIKNLPEQMARQISYLIENPNEYKRISEHNRHYSNQFTINTMTQQVKKIYISQHV